MDGAFINTFRAYYETAPMLTERLEINKFCLTINKLDDFEQQHRGVKFVGGVSLTFKIFVLFFVCFCFSTFSQLCLFIIMLITISQNQ